MTPTKILVTGGAGFIGSHVVDRLIELGHGVTVIDDLSAGRAANLSPAATLYETDIAGPAIDDVLRAERPEVVCHFAAQISVTHSMRDPVADANTNIIGSLNLLESCVRNGVRKVVYTSSGGAIYGEPQYLPCDEAHPVQPLSYYGASKYAVEKYLHVYKAAHGLDYTALRLGNVYGPRQDPTGEAGVVAIFAQAMLEGRPITIFGTGEQERDFVYVRDVAEAAVAALERGGGESYNIGAGVGASVNRVYALLREGAGYAGEASYAAARPGDVFRIYLDASKAREGLGWAPRHSLEDGLRETLRWFAGGN